MTRPCRPALPSSVDSNSSENDENSLRVQNACSRSCAEHGDDVHAKFGEPSGDRVDHCRADAAGYADRRAFCDQVAWPAQRTDDVVDPISGREADEVGCALSNRLDHDHDRAFVGVAVGDRQRNALRAGAESNDDELARPADGGNAWSPGPPTGARRLTG